MRHPGSAGLPLASVLAIALALAGCGGRGGNDAPRARSPVITGLADVTVAANETSRAFAFSVADDGGADALALRGTSGDPSLVPASGIRFGGSGTDRTIAVTPTPGRTGSVLIQVLAEDRTGRVGTGTFRVTIDTQSVSFAAIFRDAFAAGPNDAPVSFDARTFADDAGPRTFDDLVDP